MFAPGANTWEYNHHHTVFTHTHTHVETNPEDIEIHPLKRKFSTWITKDHPSRFHHYPTPLSSTTFKLMPHAVEVPHKVRRKTVWVLKVWVFQQSSARLCFFSFFFFSISLPVSILSIKEEKQPLQVELRSRRTLAKGRMTASHTLARSAPGERAAWRIVVVLTARPRLKPIRFLSPFVVSPTLLTEKRSNNDKMCPSAAPDRLNYRSNGTVHPSGSIRGECWKKKRDGMTSRGEGTGERGRERGMEELTEDGWEWQWVLFSKVWNDSLETASGGVFMSYASFVLF